MTITVSIPDQLASRAVQSGMSVEKYVEKLLASVPYEAEQPFVRFGPGPLTPEQAADDIRELRKGVTLGGLSIKDLINEGRKF